MIPELVEPGLLPPGIHSATWDEFAERFIIFQRSDQRLRVGERLQALYDEVRASGIVRRLLVAGSYVTDKAEPNDFDCVLVLDRTIIGKPLRPFQYNLLSHRMSQRIFKGDVFAAFDGSPELDKFLEFFQTTRDGERMGIVEIEL